MATQTKKFQILYADPPWDYAGQKQHGTAEQGTNKSVEDHYNTMKLAELKKLQIPKICEKDALLFLWTSSPHLPQAIELMSAWEFDYKTVAFVWEKQKTNPGYYTMSQCEICLVGKRRGGQIPKPRGSRKERQFLSAMRGRHSEKPDEIRQRIQRMFPTQKKVELFARTAPDGWAVWGNEVENTLNETLNPTP
jgi:N6-adenosine-specific RNA methylase IME4